MEKIKEWLKVNNGSGDGYGDGSGSGSGYGYGDGDGSGYGSGDGYGSGAGSGDGYGYGSGSGYGSGDGYGDGYGYGSGSGYGSGDGYGYGSGDGYGVKEFDGKTVYIVDGVQTIITRIKLALAKGFILNSDLTLTPCYIAKGNGYFAHGETAKEAQEALRSKIFENMSAEEAIDKFCDTFKKGEQYAGKLFYEWHHYLTGSCDMGRKAFIRNHDLNIEDTFTVDEFIALCENDYGGEVIKQLKERYEE